MQISRLRRRLIASGLIAAGCALALYSPSAQAAYPDRPVHIVVGYAPGGGADLQARIFAQALSEKWKQSVVVDNKAGADGTIAANFVAHAAPDGYTLDLITTNHTVTPNQMKLSYDPVKSFAPVTLLGVSSQVLALNPNVLPVHSLKELIAAANAEPGKLNFGSGGFGSPAYMNMALLETRTGIRMTNVSYRGMGPATVSLLGGEVQLLFAGTQDVVQLVKDGKLRALAVSTRVRVPSLPDVPTIEEATGLTNFDEGSLNGVLAPAGTPKAIVDKLHDDFIAVMQSPELMPRLSLQGYSLIGDTPEQFTQFLNDDIAKWGAVLKAIGYEREDAEKQ